MDELSAIVTVLALLPWWLSAPIGAVLAVAIWCWFFNRKQ